MRGGLTYFQELREAPKPSRVHEGRLHLQCLASSDQKLLSL